MAALPAHLCFISQSVSSFLGQPLPSSRPLTSAHSVAAPAACRPRRLCPTSAAPSASGNGSPGPVGDDGASARGRSGNGVPAGTARVALGALEREVRRLRAGKQAAEETARQLQSQLRARETAGDLTQHIAAAAAEAVRLALGRAVVDKAQEALARAAKAEALASEMRDVLQRSRDAQVRRLADMDMHLAAEKKAVVRLRERLTFAENALAVTERELQLAKKAPASSEEGSGKESESHRKSTYLVNGFVTVDEAKACLSSLLLYPDVTQGATGGKHGVGIPAFLRALSEYCDGVASLMHSDQVPASKVVQAYANLWRAASTPDRRGWRGEIIHAALTGADRDLMSAVAFHPDSRRALQNDLRAFQALCSTDPQNVKKWLSVATKDLNFPKPLSIPLYCSSVPHSEGADAAEGEKGQSDEADEEEVKLTRLLENSADWGEESVALAVARFCVSGPSHQRSVADDFYGLKWDSASSQLVGVLSAKNVRESSSYSFIGVENIRERLTRNVEFLLEGLKAQNCLLYGPPGCGKSSMVLSLLRSHGDRGLRLVQIGKDDMVQLPEIIESIAPLKQKFILFIDDLTFDDYENEAMRTGKAALEGSLRVEAKNWAVVVTSNRRYPVGSKLTDGTLEKLAFSHRFGIVLSFRQTTRKAYLEIVKQLTKEAGIVMDEKKLETAAIQWALGNDGNSHGVSGRTARQFVDFLHSEQTLRGGDAPIADYMISAGNVNAGAAPANMFWQVE